VTSKPRFLVTTALEETWPKDEPVLFLGEWCRLYTRKERWASMDADLLPYHWDDRDRLLKDSRYLVNLYEGLLPAIAEALNRQHAVRHEVRFWRILIGPWLIRFVHVLFDRWTSILSARDHCQLLGTIVLKNHEDGLIPDDMNHFVRLFQSDAWNHHIYGEVLERVGGILVAAGLARVDLPAEKLKTAKTNIKKILIDIYINLSKSLVKSYDLFFYDTYLSREASVRLQLSFYQLPQMKYNGRLAPVRASPDQRNWKIKYAAQNEFEQFLLGMIPRQLPKCYLENYSSLIAMIGAVPWPRAPKLIFTSNSLWHDDIAKAYVAENVGRGAVLVHGQHGGGYGTALVNLDEDHEVSIADRYLSMGWSDPIRTKVLPVGQFKCSTKWAGPFNKKDKLLLVTLNTSRYPFRACSESALNIINHVENSFTFVASLKESIQRAVIVRLTAGETGWFHSLRWRDRMPKILLENGQGNIYKLMKESRLVVTTYNQTAILETLALGVPSVLICDTKQTPLRESAVPFYRALQRVGIFHDNPLSAAAHVDKVWTDVDAWWSRNDVQDAVENFTQNYCVRNRSIVNDIKNVFQEALTEKI
jgi:putative transferase (TIGR04331 family)